MLRHLYEYVGLLVGPTGRESMASKDQQSRVNVELRRRESLLQDALLLVQP